MKTNLQKWPMEYRSTRMPRAPQRLELSEATIHKYGLSPDAFGLMLELPPQVVPASSLPPEELEARILFHQNRIAADLARMEEESRQAERRESERRERGSQERQERVGRQRAASVKCPVLPRGLKYRDLKIVSCARCSRTLLGESQEPLREEAVARRLRTASNFPPPVAARLHGGRPYCAMCAAAVN